MSLKTPEAGWTELIKKVRGALPPVATPDAFDEKCGALLDLVCSWNKRVNLTGAKSAKHLADLYLADSLVLAAHEKPGESWLDVGSGGGAPGLALALAAPETAFTFVEPRQKRVSFLRMATGALGLENVTVVRGRFEHLDDAEWDVAVARATFPPQEWLERAEAVQPRDIWVLLTDGDDSAQPTSARRVCELRQSYEWPLSGLSRTALRYVEAPELSLPRGDRRCGDGA